MRDQRLERRLNILKVAGIVPAETARDIAVILESWDVVLDPGVAKAIEDAWCRIKTYTAGLKYYGLFTDTTNGKTEGRCRHSAPVHFTS